MNKFRKIWMVAGYFAAVYSAGVTVPHVGGLLLIIASVVSMIVIYAKLIYKLAKSFGHGAGYTVGLLFLEPVFMMIMGFGRDEYVAA